MKTAWTMMLGLAVALLLVVGARADDEKKKEVTLKGKICCAKCELKEEGRTKCHTVIVAKDKDDKEVTYYFDDEGSKKNHKKICTEAKNGKVTGTVEEKDGKKWITVSKVEFDE
jgi:hypothetical protein